MLFSHSKGVRELRSEALPVIRKLIRRASFFGFLMKIYEPYLYKGVFLVSKLMGGVYKEIKEKQEVLDQWFK